MQILEFSVLFLILNFSKIALRNIEILSDLKFLSEKNEKLKNEIISIISNDDDTKLIESKINPDFEKLVEEINENSNIQIITKGKTDQDIEDYLKDLIHELNEQNNLKKIESLEKELINNLDEGAYSELIKLKSQLNRD